MFPVGDGKKNRVALRAEAVKAVLDLMQVLDPVETYDRVMIIHNIRYNQA